ncbi:type II toxin-antitoxin system PemK/MazF family toxin [Candidatus Parcubacteria bacterium]|nr:type II toxin-antitoxin system PemK/MazF family toxin [Candidatus Parcubacteria bacterium]
MKYGEIWSVVFGEKIGHEYTKDRPVLIIESNQQMNITNVITLVPLTSQVKNKHGDDISIKKDNANNLYYDCLIKVHHIQSFDKSRFIKRIGEADEQILNKVKEYLKTHFAIN